MNLIGLPLTKGVLIGAAIVVALLLGVIGAEAIALKWLDAKLDTERARYAELQGKNARCETEATSVKAALAAQTKAVKDWKDTADKAMATSKTALKDARQARTESDRKVAEIQATKPIDPSNLCKSAIHELRQGVGR